MKSQLYTLTRRAKNRHSWIRTAPGILVPQGHIVIDPDRGGPPAQRGAAVHHEPLRLEPLRLDGADGGVPDQALPQQHPLRVGVSRHRRLRLQEQAVAALGAEGGPR
jgi:hypothetical protein